MFSGCPSVRACVRFNVLTCVRAEEFPTGIPSVSSIFSYLTYCFYWLHALHLAGRRSVFGRLSYRYSICKCAVNVYVRL